MAAEVIELIVKLLEGLKIFSNFKFKTIKRIARVIFWIIAFSTTVLSILILYWVFR